MAHYREVSLREIKEAEIMLLKAHKNEAPVYASETYLESQLTLRKAKAMMNAEKYRNAKSLAQQAKEIGEQATEKSQEERMRVKARAERLLFRGEEIWSRYEKGDEKEYAPGVLIEIKKLLDDGRRFLDGKRYMDALDAAKKSHQKLATVPEDVEKGKVFMLDEEKKRRMGRKTGEEIIQSAQVKASQIIEDARKKAQKILLAAQVSAAQARLEEFERIYPTIYKVKKGETIIDIARRRDIFNDQFMWPLIYKANRDQIRDPKIVFPGQVLTIPRDIAFEDIIEARKQAKAPPPYIPPYDAYNPEFYRRYLLIVPESIGAEEAGSNTSPD